MSELSSALPTPSTTEPEAAQAEAAESFAGNLERLPEEVAIFRTRAPATLATEGGKLVEGFTPHGVAPRGTEGFTPRVATRDGEHVGGFVPSSATENEARGAGKSEKDKGALGAEPPKPPIIGALSQVKGLGYMGLAPFWMEVPGAPMDLPVLGISGMLLGWMGAGLSFVGWKSGAKALETARTPLRMVNESVYDVFQKGTLGDSKAWAGIGLRKAAAIAAGAPIEEKGLLPSARVRESHLAKYEKPLNELAERTDARMGKFAAKAGVFFAPLRRGTAQAIRTFSNSGVGRAISEHLSSLMRWRHGRVQTTVRKSWNNAHAAFNQKPRGFWEIVMLKKNKEAEIQDKLAPVHEMWQQAEKQTGQARVDALAEVASTLEQIAKDNKALEGHANHILGKVKKAAGVSAKSLHLGNVAEGGVETLLHSIGKTVGQTKLATALIGVGVVAGAGVYSLTAGNQDKEAAAQLKDFAADIGNKHSPLLKAARAKNALHTVGRYAGAALSTAGDAVLLKNGGMAGFEVMPEQFALSSAGGMLAGKNPVLIAHATLKKAERGEIQLEGKDMLEAVKQLVAAVPEVEAKGGMYNRLTRPVAEAMIAKHMPVREMMHLLDNKVAFMQFAAEVKAAQEAAVKAATAAKPLAAPQTPVANDTAATMDMDDYGDAVAPAATTSKPAATTSKPTAAAVKSLPPTKIAASAAQHQGTINDPAQLAMA